MKSKQKFGKPWAVIVLAILFITVFLFTAGIIYAKSEVKANAGEGPKKVINEYMNALKNKDFDKVFKVLGFNVDERILDKIKEWLSNEDYFVWRVRGYKITDVKVDGGFAKVYVVETDYKEFKGEAKEIEKIIPSGVTSVKEVFYLFKDEGKWRIDPGNSWVDFRTFPFKAEELKDMSKIIKEERLKAWIDTIGFGQAFTAFADHNLAPVLSLVIPNAFPEIMRTKAENEFIACQSNLKNIATALEMYSTDNEGNYPISLEKLTPDYIRIIPPCPAAGKDTYSSSYTSSQNPDAFTVYCSGNSHQEVNAGENYPQYNSERGLIPKQNTDSGKG